MRGNEKLNPLGYYLVNDLAMVQSYYDVVENLTFDINSYNNILCLVKKVMTCTNETVRINYLEMVNNDFKENLSSYIINNHNPNCVSGLYISVNDCTRYYNLLQQLMAIGFKGIFLMNNQETSLEITDYNSQLIEELSAYLTFNNTENDMRLLRNCKLNIELRIYDFDYIYGQLELISDDCLTFIEYFLNSFLSIELHPIEFVRFIEILERFRVANLN